MPRERLQVRRETAVEPVVYTVVPRQLQVNLHCSRLLRIFAAAKGSYMIKALFFDIDGTLVSFRTHSVPDSTVKALAEAKNKGIKIFISTGRPRPLINNLEPIEDLIDGYITVNGAICTVGSETVSRSPIDPEDVKVILNAADRMDVPALIVGEDRAIVHNHKPIVDRIFGGMLAITGIDRNTATEQMLTEPIYQMTPFFDTAQEAEVARLLRHSESTRWCEYFSDIISSEADKGRGLEIIAGHEGLRLDECMAFGDGGNDISILRKAGTGVAMGNAGVTVKAAADYVTDTIDSDGVANALRYFKVTA